MIFSKKVFCGATKPLRPPGILTVLLVTALLLLLLSVLWLSSSEIRQRLDSLAMTDILNYAHCSHRWSATQSQQRRPFPTHARHIYNRCANIGGIIVVIQTHIHTGYTFITDELTHSTEHWKRSHMRRELTHTIQDSIDVKSSNDLSWRGRLVVRCCSVVKSAAPSSAYFTARRCWHDGRVVSVRFGERLSLALYAHVSTSCMRRVVCVCVYWLWMLVLDDVDEVFTLWLNVQTYNTRRCERYEEVNMWHVWQNAWMCYILYLDGFRLRWFKRKMNTRIILCLRFMWGYSCFWHNHDIHIYALATCFYMSAWMSQMSSSGRRCVVSFADQSDRRWPICLT